MEQEAIHYAIQHKIQEKLGQLLLENAALQARNDLLSQQVQELQGKEPDT